MIRVPVSSLGHLVAIFIGQNPGGPRTTISVLPAPVKKKAGDHQFSVAVTKIALFNQTFFIAPHHL
jgi:hypothetical protein